MSGKKKVEESLLDGFETFLQGSARSRADVFAALRAGAVRIVPDALGVWSVDPLRPKDPGTGEGRLSPEDRQWAADVREPTLLDADGLPTDLEALGVAVVLVVPVRSAGAELDVARLIVESASDPAPEVLGRLERYGTAVADVMRRQLAMFAPSGWLSRASFASLLAPYVMAARRGGPAPVVLAVTGAPDMVGEATEVGDLGGGVTGLLVDAGAADAIAERIAAERPEARIGRVSLGALPSDADGLRAVAAVEAALAETGVRKPLVEWTEALMTEAPPGSGIDRSDLLSLWRLFDALGQSGSLDDLFVRTLERLVLIFGADHGALWGPPEDRESGWSLRLSVDRPGFEASVSMPDRDASLIGRAVDSKDVESFEATDGLRAVAVSLRCDGDVFGVLYLGNERGTQKLRDQDRAYLRTLAKQIGGVLKDVRTLGQAKRRERQAGEHLRKQAIELRRLLRARAGLIGDHPTMTAVMRSIERCRTANVPVLITGETGTGKEAAARLIHRLSNRRGPLVVVDCGAIPGSLLESELFGHEKGAFTGAEAQKIGRFQEADGGTIFLDEIGELPLELQPKLLRVLQESTVRPVGGTEEIQLDFRLVAATNRDLRSMVKQRTFREDLLFRLRVMEIQLPSLRERGEDVILLALYFLRQYCVETGRDFLSISPEAQEALLSHPWPGNVRELQNTIRRAVLLAPGPELQPQDLQLGTPQAKRSVRPSGPGPEAAQRPAPVSVVPPEGSLEDAVADWFWEVWVTSESAAPPQEPIEAYLLRAALKTAQGSIGTAAELLGMHADTFGSHLTKVGSAAASRPVRGHALAVQLDAILQTMLERKAEIPVMDRILAVLLRELLVRCKGNKSEMARTLGWGRQTLLRHMKRLDILTAAS